MDLAASIVIFVIALIIFALCGYCCKRKREGTVYGYNTTVTSANAPVPVPGATPVVVPPYPIDPRHPTPHSSGPPGLGFASHSTPYPPSSMPYPPAGPSYPPVSIPGVPAGGAYPPYPPTTATPYPPGGDPHANPPPYDVAVASPPVHPPPPVQEAYGKQSPYNPGYPN